MPQPVGHREQGNGSPYKHPVWDTSGNLVGHIDTTGHIVLLDPDVVQRAAQYKPKAVTK